MDSVSANGVSENILNSKINSSAACDQGIQLTKMEIVDDQSDVHLENANPQHIVETQFINIHRVSDLKNLMADSIPPELLSNHVVDLGSNPEYSQHIVTNAQFYDNADFLSQSFTDEDRRLGLVAVQLIQPNRHNSTSTDNNLNNDLLNGKNTLPSVSSLSADKSVMSAIVPNYVQAVDQPVSRNQSPMNIHIAANHSQVSEQHIDKESESHNNQIIKLYQPLLQENKLQILPQLKKINQSLISRNSKYLTAENRGCNPQSIIVNTELNPMQSITHQISEPLNEIKTECVPGDLHSDQLESGNTEEYESDGENETRSSQKRLPHKKRIPNKLKRALSSTPTRNIHAKCYKCTKCGEQFPTQSTFNNHKLQHSSRKAAYACELCNKTCANQLKFFEHLKSHYEPNAHRDEIKTESVEPVEPQLDQNLDSQLQPQENGEAERQIAENQNHSSYSSEPNKILTCGKCGWVFRRQKAFDCHMSISHPKQEEIEEFSEPEDMMEGIRHVVNMVPTGDEEDKNYEPWHSPKNVDNMVLSQQVTDNESVPKILPSPKNLSSVKKKEEFVDEEVNIKPRKEMSCPHCERTFVHRNSLLYHIRSHTGHRPHQCELCGKSFFAAGALKIHLRLHSGDKPYKCEYCGRFFRQWGDLKYHITSLHSNTKMFQCEYCGKDFARKYSLVVHRRIHTGEKNYICEYCTKTFRAASYLQNHRRIHTGEKPHMCQVCGKPFRVRSDMKRHMKTHPDVNVVSVLTELSNNTSENNSEVREASCLVNNQELAIPKQEDISNSVVSDQDSEQNIKPVVTDSGTPLNLNVRPDNAPEIFNYPRDGLDDDRENANTGTLYVWIQTSSDSIISET